jgi:hypothetical protein
MQNYDFLPRGWKIRIPQNLRFAEKESNLAGLLNREIKDREIKPVNTTITYNQLAIPSSML